MIFYWLVESLIFTRESLLGEFSYVGGGGIIFSASRGTPSIPPSREDPVIRKYVLFCLNFPVSDILVKKS